jgi:hypothetical protein
MCKSDPNYNAMKESCEIEVMHLKKLKSKRKEKRSATPSTSRSPTPSPPRSATISANRPATPPRSSTSSPSSTTLPQRSTTPSPPHSTLRSVTPVTTPSTSHSPSASPASRLVDHPKRNLEIQKHYRTYSDNSAQLNNTLLHQLHKNSKNPKNLKNGQPAFRSLNHQTPVATDDYDSQQIASDEISAHMEKIRVAGKILGDLQLQIAQEKSMVHEKEGKEEQEADVSSRLQVRYTQVQAEVAGICFIL